VSIDFNVLRISASTRQNVGFLRRPLRSWIVALYLVLPSSIVEAKAGLSSEEGDARGWNSKARPCPRRRIDAKRSWRGENLIAAYAGFLGPSYEGRCTNGESRSIVLLPRRA
jgi:hypothetical protein